MFSINSSSWAYDNMVLDNAKTFKEVEILFPVVFDNIAIAAEREANRINVPKMIQERNDAIDNATNADELE